MEKGAAKPQTEQNERSEFCEGPSRLASPDTARPPKAAGPKKKEKKEEGLEKLDFFPNYRSN
ncbi:hypothetical protein SGRA_4210 [Saprospira grandis str. Lewin]|uniref:Uncharacterized protein n=1 Tax=Saprospira grandis (strain Lewin) TaxID=984262 RepID=H6L7H4_SAPGL|nr:hypothetical protein [Saprospira grandis]AFC26925.1 hypothetical protein SGRA_4210 [Saprospira grandis str. Lewin]